jgi:hypothetical protein
MANTANASSNTSLNVVALDFATVRSSLQNYLSGQTQFKDYNFDGPNISVLLDLLSYNTFNNAFYLNMVASEMFLDSAQMRDSVISHAKELNYTPASNFSAYANVNITITTGDGTTGVVIPQYTTFTGRVGSNTYTFSTNTVITAVSNTNIITANNVTLYEGIITNDQFTVNYANTTQRFILSNPGIDVTSLSISSLENGGSSLIPYQQYDSLFGVTANTTAFFVQAAQNGQYEVKFGDNVTGRTPLNGAIIIAQYRVASGDGANDISSFKPNGTVDGQANVVVTVNEASSGGAYAEGIDSIRFNAPRYFATQERCVTTEDYETLLQQNFPEIYAVSAVGGEDVIPPQFGSVIIAVAITGVDLLPSSKITEYTNFVQPRAGLTVTPQFVNPAFLYVGLNSTINYNINITSVDPSYIESEVQSIISQYNSQYLSNFKVTLRYSPLVRFIDGADASILGNETDLFLISRLQPTILGVSSNYDINFGQALSEITSTGSNTTISSDTFTYNNKQCTIADDGEGNVNLIAFNGGSHTPLFQVGTVNYATGSLSLTNLEIDATPSYGYVKIYATPANKDLVAPQSTILLFDPNEINLNVLQVSE